MDLMQTGWLVALALSCSSEEPAVLILDGPEQVRVDHLGPVEAPRVMLEDGAEPRGVIWTAAPEGVARLEGGQVVAIGPGEARVVAEWEEQTVEWTLVVELARVLAFHEPPSRVAVGEQVQLKVAAHVGEAEVGPGDVRWTSSAPALLSVAPDGRAVGITPGTAWVTARASGAKAMVQIDVVAP
jgi:hypothetical protein